MNEKKLTIVRRKMELEDYIKRHPLKEKSISDIIVKLFAKFSNIDDIEYLVDAYQMPIDEIEEALNQYDRHSWLDKPDEILFVKTLVEKYGVDRSKIIKRIQDVRRINSVKNAGFKVKKRKKHEK